MKRESLNTSIPSHHLQSRSGMLNHTGGTHSHSAMMDNPRIPQSELNLGKFPDSLEFQSWKVNFRTVVCLRTADPQITVHWFKEVEIEKSIDELVTSRLWDKLVGKKSSLGKTYKMNKEANDKVYDLNQQASRYLETLALLYSNFEESNLIGTSTSR